jgi:hypothetical protein
MRVTVLAVGLGMAMATATSAHAGEPIKIAVLSAQLQNDHAEWVPTSDAERQRLVSIEDTLKSMLEASGKYKLISISPSIQGRINSAQKMGKCGGCEIDFGKELGARQVAWIEVQKVSELILNLNVYISDVDSGQLIFERSADLRGNNDASWQHAMKFLVNNYLLHPDDH